MKLMALKLDGGDRMVIRFILFCKREIIFETIFWLAGTRNKTSLEVPIIAPVIARATSY